MQRIRAIDLFCGAGGSSWGARDAGVDIVAGFDAWELAGKVYWDNFPEAAFHHKRLEYCTNRSIKSLGKIDLILASPECTNHSPAKGNKPRCEKSRETAFQVTRFARLLAPRWIVIENVVSMRNWLRYEELLDELSSLGYNTKAQVLTASDFGVPQRRRRLFVVCDREQEPREVKPTSRKPPPAIRAVNMNGKYRYNPLVTTTRSKATLERARRAMQELGRGQPFLIVYYGSDQAGGWQRLSEPLRTITTLDRFALVRPDRRQHVMRMLQVPELRKAMGMPTTFRFDHGTRRDRIRMLGNAVCSPVMKAVIREITTNA
jgi:DNA (cytosine-5)-methyltransferase 1